MEIIMLNFLSSKFGFNVQYVSTSEWRGHYTPGVCLISDSAPEKTLWHELGHHLINEGYLSLKGPHVFVKNYFKKVDKDWLYSYNRWEREEEVIVESFALWAIDKPEEFKAYLYSLV
jgi:hypothetical protein